MVQCINKQTVVLLLHPRTVYKKVGPFLERGISFRANSRTGCKKKKKKERGVKIGPFLERGIHFSGNFL